MKKNALAQPLMMRCDYGTPDEKKDKEALMIKEVPIEDYDQVPKKPIKESKFFIEDYDNYGCRGGCFLCDR